MKSRTTKILIIAFAVVLIAAVAVSQTLKRVHQGSEFGFGGHMMGFMADYLDLTDAQRAQAKDIMAKEKSTIKPLLEQLGQAHKQLRTLEEGPAFDEAKVRTLASQNSQLVTELIVQKARIKNELFQILTQEQKDKVAKFEARHEARFSKHLDDAASTDTAPQQ